MSNQWFRIGLMKVKIEYVQWRRGLAYYRRRIPQSLHRHYKGKEFVFFSLKTKDPIEANRLAQKETARLDREWALLGADRGGDLAVRAKALAVLDQYGLKPGQAVEYARYDLEPDAFVADLERLSDVDGIHVKRIEPDALPDEYRVAAELFYSEPSELPKLLVPSFSEVKEKHLYFNPKRVGDAQFERSVKLFLEINDELPVDQYKRSHGNAFVQRLLEENKKSATIKRYLNQIRPLFDTAIVEMEIQMTNPLAKLKIPKDDASEGDERQPFSLDQLRAIQKRCREVNDPRRWVISLLSDTGARLSEIAGLEMADIDLTSSIPHIHIRPNGLRTLKNRASRRIVPLVGEALWAAKQACADNGSRYLFPSLLRNETLNKNSISAALNKWMKDQKLRGEKQPIHSLRHTMRDRLRNNECPIDIANRIVGWQNEGVGETYGAGHSLEVLQRRLLEVVL